MKYYIATSLENHAQHNALRDDLHKYGYTCTYDWTTHGSVQDQGEQKIHEVCMLEVSGVAEADVVIVLLPGGRGTHVELGLALGMNKSVILYNYRAYDRWCAFYLHDNVFLLDADEFDRIPEIVGLYR